MMHEEDEVESSGSCCICPGSFRLSRNLQQSLDGATSLNVPRLSTLPASDVNSMSRSFLPTCCCQSIRLWKC
ncbi:hypothetical protein Y1Q_0019208 [Alligator mississippiensis]|uniref:Uncharacterized protein n=1 Tax=Alligator mississippiensis TaxID=8496 RepID=A0A151MQD0_ALLMI|nr:hypothetical protein Y1Q_0019208 [Alligator mississippiensis]